MGLIKDDFLFEKYAAPNFGSFVRGGAHATKGGKYVTRGVRPGAVRSGAVRPGAVRPGPTVAAPKASGARIPQTPNELERAIAEGRAQARTGFRSSPNVQVFDDAAANGGAQAGNGLRPSKSRTWRSAGRRRPQSRGSRPEQIRPTNQAPAPQPGQQGLQREPIPGGATQNPATVSPQNGQAIAQNAMGDYVNVADMNPVDQVIMGGKIVGGGIGAGFRNIGNRSLDLLRSFVGLNPRGAATAAGGVAQNVEKNVAGAAAQGAEKGVANTAGKLSQTPAAATEGAPKVKTPKNSTGEAAGAQNAGGGVGAGEQAAPFDWNEHMDKHRNKYIFGGGMLAGGLADHMLSNNNPQPYYGYPPRFY